MRSNDEPSVIFSYDIFTAQKVGGVTRCMIELMRAGADLGLNWSAWAGRNGNAMLRDAMTQRWAQGNIESINSAHRGRMIASLTEEPKFARRSASGSAAIVHRTYYPIWDMVGKKTIHVETLHDLWDERSSLRSDKGAAFRSFIKMRACHRADAVVCVSEHTRDEAIERWPSLANKIVVIPHGVRLLSHNPTPPNVDGPYFLFVGQRGFYKNFIVVVEALRRSGLDHKLICFGGSPLSDQERMELSALGMSDRIERIEGTDDDLAGLYANATALLYPSSFEGFGLPLLEAMIHNCPVISSPLTSLPEVGGHAVLYADPIATDAWIDCMKKLAGDDDLAANLRAKGQKRAAEFSWTHSADRHRQLYRSLV